MTVEYRLTDLGQELAATLRVVREWAYANIGRVQESRIRFDAARN